MASPLLFLPVLAFTLYLPTADFYRQENKKSLVCLPFYSLVFLSWKDRKTAYFL